MSSRKRCPKGTRRKVNKKTGKVSGRCRTYRPKRRLRSNSKRTRRCPNGSRRKPAKTGQCRRKSAKKSAKGKSFLDGIKSITPF